MLERGNFPDMSGTPASDLRVIDLDRILSILRRQAKVLALCAGIGICLGVIYLMLAPRTYIVTSQILIDKKLEQVVSDVTAPTPSAVDLESEILNQIEILRSSRIAAVVAEAANLTTDTEFLNPPPSFTGRIRNALEGMLGGAPEPMITEASPETVNAMLRRDVVVERVGRSSVIRVGFEAPSRELALKIASAYTDAFVQDQLNADLEATREAADWLQQRLTELGENQRQATLAVEQYRRESGLSVAQDQTLADQRLEALTDQLVLAQSETANFRALSTQLEAVIEAGPEAAASNAALLSGAGMDEVEINAIRARYSSILRRIAEITASFGPDHPQLPVLEADKTAVSNQIFAQLQVLKEQYANQLSIAQRHEAGLREDIEQEGLQAAETNQSQVELNELQQRSAALSILYNSFLSRYEESIQRQSFPIPAVRVITEPSIPKDPASPRTTLVLAGATLFGLFMGLGFGAINELRERTFRVGSQITRELGLRFLGYLPKLQTRGLGRGGLDKAQFHRLLKAQVINRGSGRPTTAFMETLKGGKILLQARHRPGRGVVVGVVSVLPGEGKTTYAVALAEMLAAGGSRVLLIDADLRQPMASRLVTPNAKFGLMDVARGMPWRQIAQTDQQTGLVTLPGVSSSNEVSVGDVLSSQAMQALLEESRLQFDYVVIDLPPLGPVMDALSILPWTDGFMLVTEWGRTPRRLVRALLEREPQLAQEVLGVVLNKVDFEKLARYSEPGGAERYVGAYDRYYKVSATADN
jgi:polysaccharide biosynthesis transport protein